MYPSTPIAANISESRSIPAFIILDYWQDMYIYRLFSLLDLIPTKNIPLITLQIRDKSVQLKD